MIARATPQRLARRRPLRPYRQGEFDGLCGVYAVVNAVCTLCPEIDHDGAGALFCELMRLPARLGANPAIIVTDGVGRRQLAQLIRHAAAYMHDEFEITLAVRRMPRALRRSSTLEALWAHLIGAVTPTSVAVLGLGGVHSHWTVAIQVTPNQIRLSDSGRLRVLKRRHCTVGRAVTRHGISATHVFVIARSGD